MNELRTIINKQYENSIVTTKWNLETAVEIEVAALEMLADFSRL